MTTIYLIRRRVKKSAVCVSRCRFSQVLNQMQCHCSSIVRLSAIRLILQYRVRTSCRLGSRPEISKSGAQKATDASDRQACVAKGRQMQSLRLRQILGPGCACAAPDKRNTLLDLPVVCQLDLVSGVGNMDKGRTRQLPTHWSTRSMHDRLP